MHWLAGFAADCQSQVVAAASRGRCFVAGAHTLTAVAWGQEAWPHRSAAAACMLTASSCQRDAVLHCSAAGLEMLTAMLWQQEV